MQHAHMERHQHQHGQRRNHDRQWRQEHCQEPLQNPQQLRDPERLVRQRGREPPTPTAESLNGRDADQHGGWQLHHSSTGLPFYFNRTTGESVWARGNTGVLHGTYLGGGSKGKDAAIVPGQFAGMHSGRTSGSAGGSSGALPGLESSENGSSSSNSSDTVSTSSASYASPGGSYTSDNDNSGAHDVAPTSSSSSSSSSSSASESSDASSSSGGSWTSSMESGFRRMIISEEGRKMLAMEVEALKLREVARRARPQSPTTARIPDLVNVECTAVLYVIKGTPGTRNIVRRWKAPPYPSKEREPRGEDDVEMALLNPNVKGSRRENRTSSGSGSSSSDSTSDSSDTRSTGSSFTLHLSSESDGASDLSLLTSDVVLDRLEKVERILIVARRAALSVLRVSCGFGRCASVLLWTNVRRGAMRARRFISTERSGSLTSTASPPSPFSPSAI